MSAPCVVVELAGCATGRSLHGDSIEQVCQQPLPAAIVADDDVGPRAHQAVALPGVDAAAVHLVAGHRHRDAADALDLLDLDEAVAEAEQLVAAQVVLAAGCAR